MKFFLPGITKRENLEYIYDVIKKFNAEEMGAPITGRRIFRVKYKLDDQDVVAEVGQRDPCSGERVVAILESYRGSYCVCTMNHGVTQGGPIVIAGKPQDIEDFQENTDPSE